MRIKIKKTGSYNSSKKYIDLIEKASVYDIAINSPITFAPNISQKERNKIYLKVDKDGDFLPIIDELIGTCLQPYIFKPSLIISDSTIVRAFS